MARGDSAEAPTGVRPKLEKPVVLVLEDDVDARSVLSIALRDADFDVREVGSLAEANAALGEIVPEVVVADRSLPDGDGFVDFVASLRRDPRFVGTPCIALTGGSSAKDIEDAVLAGCDVYFVKPVAPEVVVARVREQSMMRVRRRRDSTTA